MTSTAIGTPDRVGNRILPADRRAHAGDHLLGGATDPIDRGLLRRRPVGQPAAERVRPGRRLHERSLVSRHRRAGRAERLRRDDLRHRLDRRLAGADVLHRRAAAESRQVHVRRCRCVPVAAAAGPDRGCVRRHTDAALLHDCADGRRRQSGDADVRHLVRVRGRHRRRGHAALRAVRRDDRDHVGADHQGDPAARRRHRADGARARASSSSR